MNCMDIVTTFWAADVDQTTTLSSTDAVLSETGQFLVGTEYTISPYNITFPAKPYAVTYNPCTPYLSIPSRIITLDPRWHTCNRNFRGLHDPPSILTAASGFSAVTNRDPAPGYPTKTNGASAGHAAQHPSATKTPAPGTEPTAFKFPAVIRIGGSTITANSASAFVIGTQTLAPGGKITDFGTVLSMATDGRALLIGGTSTQVLNPSYAIVTQTISAGGPAVTVSGTVMSVKSGGEIVVIGGSVTEDLSVLLQGETSKIGSRLGGSTTSASGFGAGDITSSGSASGKMERNQYIAWQVMLCVVVEMNAFI